MQGVTVMPNAVTRRTIIDMEKKVKSQRALCPMESLHLRSSTSCCTAAYPSLEREL